MTELTAGQFAEFFEELYEYSPMTWQSDLASAACNGDWPAYICLPTGAGKTSTLDIAVFALALQADMPAMQRTAAMRTFLVVDRRTVVSEAFHRAKVLQQKLGDASQGILKIVADRLRSYSGNQHDGARRSRQPPLSVVELRGGIYRDPAWCPSLVQPMIVTSTVDQVGSRLLFRGYGVSHSSRPIQAATVAHDSLIILDEAHISPAFSETLGYVGKYQQAPWSEHQVPLTMRVVEMTATPPDGSEGQTLEISQAELAEKATHIGRIVNTSKPTMLEVADKVKGAKVPGQLANVLVAKALDSVVLGGAGEAPEDGSPHSDDGDKGTQRKVVGIMCNMVATAKEVWSLLRKNKEITSEQVHLVIGAMRPLDRDEQTGKLRRLISTGSDRSQIEKPIFVVATQCIEVGADYDFDVLVTEAAPLDALVQRFGRLNRGGRPVQAMGHIVMRGDRVKDDQPLDADDQLFKTMDPIYGNAMSRTWNWLESVSDDQQIDLGIARFRKTVSMIDPERRRKMSSESSQAPVLLPAHLDMLCQTSVDPWPDPDVSLWLHGPQRNDPEVQVCWRADLVTLHRFPDSEDNSVELLVPTYDGQAEASASEEAVHTVSLCPPSSSECLSIPMRRVQAWFESLAAQKKLSADLTADLPSINEDRDVDSHTIPAPFRPVAWRGLEKSIVIQNVRDVRPGDTLVFPVTAGGWNELGFVPTHNDWSARSEDGKLLSSTLQLASAQRQRTVKCNREDFGKLIDLD